MRWPAGYLVFQGVAGAAWWMAVALSADVRRLTLGSLDARSLAAPDLPLYVGGSFLAAYAIARGTAWRGAAVWGLTGAVAYGTLLAATGASLGFALMVLSFLGTLGAAMEAEGWLARWVFAGPFAFREAPVDPVGHVGRSARQMASFWVPSFVLLPLGLRWIEERAGLGVSFPLPLRLAGLAIFVLGGWLGVRSMLTMAREGDGSPLPATAARRLVTNGPYARLRNPMAVAGVAQIAGAGLGWSSWGMLVVATLAATVWHLVIRPGEEAWLADRFGDDYARYRKSVPLWTPRGGSSAEVPASGGRDVSQ